MKNAERFITPELKAFEDKALSAGERALAREKALYDALLDALAPHLEADSRRWRARSRRSTRWRRSPSRRARRLVPAALRASEALHRDRARPPSGGRGAPAGRRQPVHGQRLPARRALPDARHHRPEHGRQEHLHAPGRADRPAGVDRLRTFRRRRAGSARSTRSTPASAPPTTWPTRSRPSWSR